MKNPKKQISVIEEQEEYGCEWLPNDKADIHPSMPMALKWRFIGVCNALGFSKWDTHLVYETLKRKP